MMIKPGWVWGIPVSAAVLTTALMPTAAEAACSALEVRFNPQGVASAGGREALSPQIAVWLEDKAGKFVADLFVTRSVGFMGLGNRPGQALLKSDFRWPYGRRPMALPIWAYRRGKSYGFVVMGGKCSTVYDPVDPRHGTCPPDFTGDPADDDSTIAYHGPVSSTEPYYCSPSGWRTVHMGGVDVVSCASAFYGSKGWYAPGLSSPYPPRADLKAFGGSDHADAMKFSGDNDVAAISGATPEVGKVLDPPILWPRPMMMADGDYVVRVEVSREGDFNTSWTAGKSVHEPHSEWDYLGKQFIGQPSVLYSVLFRLDATPRTAVGSTYVGYGDWQGASGTINPPDATISTTDGSGADRLHPVTDADGTWRVKVKTVGCGAICSKPATPDQLMVSNVMGSTLDLRFVVPAGVPAASYQLRYRAGQPITDADFDSAMPATAPPTDLAGMVITTKLTGLLPQTMYYVALRPLNDCGMPGPIVTASATTAAMDTSGLPDLGGAPMPTGMSGGSALGCVLSARQPPSAALYVLLAGLLFMRLWRLRRVRLDRFGQSTRPR